MRASPKTLMVLALTGLFGGVFVASSHRNLPLALEIVMPLGVIFTGLFLVSLMLRGEASKFDKDQRLKNEAIKRYRPSFIGTPKKCKEAASDAPVTIKVAERESDRWNPVAGSADHKVRANSNADEDDEGRSDNERLVEEGFKGA